MGYLNKEILIGFDKYKVPYDFFNENLYFDDFAILTFLITCSIHQGTRAH